MVLLLWGLLYKVKLCWAHSQVLRQPSWLWNYRLARTVPPSSVPLTATDLDYPAASMPVWSTKLKSFTQALQLKFVVSGVASSGLYSPSRENIFHNKIQYGFMKYEHCTSASSIMIFKRPQEKHCMHFMN